MDACIIPVPCHRSVPVRVVGRVLPANYSQSSLVAATFWASSRV